MPVQDIVPLSFDTNPYIRRFKTSKGDKRFLNLKEILSPADEYGFGIIATNAFTPEMINATLDAAWNLFSPAIIEIAESQIGYALPGKTYFEKLTYYTSMLENAIKDRIKKHGYFVPLCLHLDHLQEDETLPHLAAESGFTSVELDFSNQPTKDRSEAVKMNIYQCEPIINQLHKIGVGAEVEEGHIGDVRAREAQTREDIIAEITKVEDAVELVRWTNPEALAVFIGAAHGEFKRKPVIVYERLGEIREGLRREGIDVPLVLHAGTGQRREDFQKAIRQGARKFNYATRLWTIYENHLRQDKRGALILGEMEREARESRKSGARYVFVEFREELYRKADPQTFKNAEREIYEHICDLMENAFGSRGRAAHYQHRLDLV